MRKIPMLSRGIPVVLTERRDHLEHLRERLQRFARNVVALHGF